MDKEAVVLSLVDALASVPDPRSRHGLRHPLIAVFRLTVAAMLSGATSLYSIWQWGRLQDVETVHALGFTRDKTLSLSQLHEIFSAIDAEALEGELAKWAQAHLGNGDKTIAIDGKAVCGTWGKETPSLQLVAAYATHVSLVLAQKGGTPQ